MTDYAAKYLREQADRRFKRHAELIDDINRYDEQLSNLRAEAAQVRNDAEALAEAANTLERGEG